jgi:peptide/nickel transport system permease protein
MNGLYQRQSRNSNPLLSPFIKGGRRGISRGNPLWLPNMRAGTEACPYNFYYMKYTLLWKPILKLVLRELFITILLLLGVSLLIFSILHLAPGDPLHIFMNIQTQNPDEVAAIKRELGLDRWLPLQYLSWLGNTLHGNFGNSFRTGRPVFNELIKVGLNTLILTIGSIMVTLLIAVPIAIFSSLRRYPLLSWWLTLLAYILSALPVFWLGYIVIYIFTKKFNLFPFSLSSYTGATKLDWVYFLLPIIALGVGNGTISEIIRHLKTQLERVLSEDYIKAAKARGASIWKHGFSEGLLIPITTMVVAKIPFILGGAIIVEQVFNWPGIGRLAWQAALDRDYPIIMGITIFAAFFVHIGRLFQGIIFAFVNPQITAKEEEA